MFKLFNALFVWLYRLTGGKFGGRMRGFNVLVLTTKGRKSGKIYHTPLGYFVYEDGYLIVASNAGRPRNPAWYYNLKNDPKVTTQVQDQVLPVTANILSGEARARAWQQVITTAPAYAGYEKRTEREIPVIFLRPNKAG